MSIGVKPLVDCVNAAISTVTDPLQILQLNGLNKDFDNGFVKSVTTCTALPSAIDNRGRMIYVEDSCSHRISDGVSWTNDFTSVPQDFQAWSWSLASCGRTGDGTTVTKSSPVSVVGGFTDWCQISAGNRHSAGVRTNGSAWAWGLNSQGILGDGTTVNKSSPVSVIGGFVDWCQVSAGYGHNLGVRTNGTAWAWGYGAYGRLGNGAATNRSSPVSVIGGFVDWSQVSAGREHNLGIRTNGTAWAWGNNALGRLGDGTTVNKSSPISVVGGFTDWCQVSAGSEHSLGVRTNGTAWAWGDNFAGELGINSISDRSSPVSVIGGFCDWCQVSAGCQHSLGVRTNGTAWAWGCNGQGRLGDGTATNRSSPVSVIGGFIDWCQVSGGCAHSLGVRTNGSLWSWGCNRFGRLGDGTSVDRSSPVSVVGGFTDWYQVSAGDEHSLAIRATKGFI